MRAQLVKVGKLRRVFPSSIAQCLKMKVFLMVMNVSPTKTQTVLYQKKALVTSAVRRSVLLYVCT